MEGSRNRAAETESRRIKSFFEWLVPRLEKIFEDPGVQAGVTQKLREVGVQLGWEIGPSEGSNCFFAFSPNMDVDLLPLTTTLADAAPAVPGWVFLPAKPRKQWTKRSIKLQSATGEKQSFDLDDWKYYLTSFKDGEFFDVNIIPASSTLPGRELQRLAEFLVLSELGERIYLEFVDRVNIVLPKDLTKFANPIEHLHDQLLQQLEKHTRQ